MKRRSTSWRHMRVFVALFQFTVDCGYSNFCGEMGKKIPIQKRNCECRFG